MVNFSKRCQLAEHLRSGTVSDNSDNAFREFATIFVVLAAFVAIFTSQASADSQKAADEFHEKACVEYPSSSSPWHIANLYDCATRALYIPYQLWTGADWNGRKDGPCMHEAQTSFTVNSTSRTSIRGPKTWLNPNTGEEVEVWVRAKQRGSKVQYFTCHDKGIGRVYDNRYNRSWETGRCKFPAGFGWAVGERRQCESTAIEITKIRLNRKGQLRYLDFKWWYSSSSDWKLDHIYRYKPEYGMLNAWKQ